MKLLLFGILLALFAVLKADTNCTRNGVSCPDYEVLEVLDGYEKRLYPQVVLVSTTGTARQRKRISRTLIRRLYRYIGGYNDKNERIELMVPVRTLKSPGEDSNNYTISFFLPEKYSANPPQPTDDRVFLQREPATEYAVRSFGNFVRDERIWDEEANTLAERLGEGEVDSSDYFWAVYDPPFRHRNRLNEVWIKSAPKNENLIL